MRNAIYFPYIRVPQSEWFNRVLLYWDEVGSIMPDEYVNSSKLGDYMEGLIEERLVRPIFPRNYIERNPNFIEAFLRYVDDRPVHNYIQNEKSLTFQIHREKLNIIGDELCERGLAFKRDSFYYIENYTANQYMAYLAATLGKLPDFKSEPITDTIQNLNSFMPQYHPQNRLPRKIDELRTIVLDNILPAPKGGIEPGEIVEFKRENKKELTCFRDNIESFLINAANFDDPELRAKDIEQFILKTHNEATALKELMVEKGWERITFGRFLAYSTALVGFADFVATGGLLGAAAAALGGASAIYNTIEESQAKDTLEGNYIAYAVLAEKKFKNG